MSSNLTVSEFLKVCICISLKIWYIGNMKNMRLNSMNIDFIEKVWGSKLPETLAMTAFAPTGGGQSKRRAGLRPIGCLKPSNINVFKNLIVMQLGALSCRNSGRASPDINKIKTNKRYRCTNNKKGSVK